MMKCCSLRRSYFTAFIVGAVLLLFSIYLQVKAGLQPCALCFLQRGALIGITAIFLMGTIFNLKKLGQIIIGSLATLIAATGVILSGRQAWLQHLPKSTGETCAASLQYMLKVLPFDQVMQKIFQGSPECTQTGWVFLSLSLAEWSLICFVLFLIFSMWQTIRK